MTRATRLLVALTASAGMLATVGGLASTADQQVPERRVAFSAEDVRDDLAADIARDLRPR